MKLTSPKIDSRVFKDLLEQAQALAPFYTPEWKAGQEREPGQALLRIYLHLQAQVLSRLNRALDRNLVAFLEMMGTNLDSAQSARAAVAFTLAEGANENVLVPKGTLLSGEGANKSGEMIFETQSNLLVSPARLQKVFSYQTAEDKIFDHTSNFAAPTAFTLFTGSNQQERILYLGHEDLFNQKNPSKIKVDFIITRGSTGTRELEMAWEYWDGERWLTFTKFKFDDNKDDGTNLFARSGAMTLIKGFPGEIAKTKIQDIESRWIRCRLLNSFPGRTSVQLPVINTIRLSANPLEPFAPELAFNNDIPLEVSEIKVRMLGIQEISLRYHAIPDLKLANDVNVPPVPLPVVVLKDIPPELKIGDMLQFDNHSDVPELSEIAAIETNIMQVTLKTPLKKIYKKGSANVVFVLDAKEVFLEYPAGMVSKDDLLKFNNRVDDPEVRKVINAPEVRHKLEATSVEIAKITLEGDLRFDYTAQSLVSFVTAVRKTRTAGAKVEIYVESIEGSNVVAGNKIVLGRDEDKEAAYISNLSHGKSKTEDVEINWSKLSLEKTGGSKSFALKRLYVEGDLVKITPKIKPFGELPQLFDTFYVASEDAFSKKGAKITLTIESKLATPGPADPSIPARASLNPILSWEYWNGTSWRGIRVVDSTNRFLTDGTAGRISFTCPEDIEKLEVNGEEKFWIRARLIDGNYGAPIVIEKETFLGVKTQIGFVYFPIINDLKLSYVDIQRPPQRCLTLNNLKYEDRTEDCLSEDKLFEPFKIFAEEFSGLFLGFDKPLTSGPLRLLFDLQEQFLSEDERVTMQWLYWNGKAWQPLNVTDETENLTKIGLLEFVGSRDFARRELFGHELYWLKGVIVEGKHSDPIEMHGIHPNTTYCLQASVANDEIIGSSNGVANQEFSLQNPLVITQEIWVREPVPLAEEEVKDLRRDKGDEPAIADEPVITKKNELGETLEILVRWREEDNFDGSTDKSRHYTVDKLHGKIRFGDGNHGMIPPVGADNLRANYKFGGGKNGNVVAGAIAGLKTAVPFVNAVNNPLPADGGAEIETMDNVLVRGPLDIKHRKRAVMPEDFEALARNASRKVARAKCLANNDENGDFSPGWVTVMIVPDSEALKPEPSKLLIKLVKDELLEQCALAVSAPDNIHVQGPIYVEVTVEVSVIPTSPEFAATIEADIGEDLKRYIHPLTGGKDGAGWEFGKEICLPEIYARLEKITGVDFVEAIVLRANGRVQAGNIGLDAFTLPFSGEHKINVTLVSPTPARQRGKRPQSNCAPEPEVNFMECSTKQ